MFLKVLKYDFMAVFKRYIPIVIVVLGLSIITRLLNLIPFDYGMASLIVTGINVIFVISLVVLSIYTMVIVVMRYVKSLFRDQGYLTHTLPVNKHELLLSQLLVAVIMTTLTILLMLFCIFIAYFKPNWIEAINQILIMFVDLQLTSETIGSVILSIFTAAVTSLQSVILLYFGIALGHAHCKNKTLFSVIYCIALSYGINIALSIINIPFSELMNTYNGLMVTRLVESLAISVAGYFLTIFMMKRHLNLE